DHDDTHRAVGVAILVEARQRVRTKSRWYRRLVGDMRSADRGVGRDEGVDELEDRGVLLAAGHLEPPHGRAVESDADDESEGRAGGDKQEEGAAWFGPQELGCYGDPDHGGISRGRSRPGADTVDSEVPSFAGNGEEAVNF